MWEVFYFHWFLSQDGTNGAVKRKALEYKQITYMQVINVIMFFLSSLMLI